MGKVMYSILKPIEECGILPVVQFDNDSQALKFASAIKEGGMPFMEVLFRTEAASSAIMKITKKYPDFLVGAGTIINIDQAEDALTAGAKFLILPGFDSELITYGMERGVPVIPGCVTPAEIQQALKLGVKVQKFFPAEAYGGVKTLNFLYGPYPEVKFIPTGIDLELLNQYITCPNVAAVGGQFMFGEAALKDGDFEKITKNIKMYTDIKSI